MGFNSGFKGLTLIHDARNDKLKKEITIQHMKHRDGYLRTGMRMVLVW